MDERSEEKKATSGAYEKIARRLQGRQPHFHKLKSVPARLTKQVFRKIGVAFFKRPNETLLGPKPYALVLTNFFDSTLLSFGRFVWLTGALNRSSGKISIWPTTTKRLPQNTRSDDRFVLSSFLNTVVRDESYRVTSIFSRELEDADYLVLGDGSHLVDGSTIRAHNYFHFLLQAVPAWLLLDADQALVLKIRGIRDWQKSVCKELEIPWSLEARAVPVTSEMVSSKGMYPTRIAVSALRERIHSTIVKPADPDADNEEGSPRPRRILFVNRTQSTSLHAERMISNLKEVREELGSVFEVKIEDLGSKSFREQFHLVNWADVLCGPHGAGLSNAALHLQPKSLCIVELVNDENVRWHFERLAQIIGSHFQRFFVGGTGAHGMIVDPQELIRAINEVSQLAEQ